MQHGTHDLFALISSYHRTPKLATSLDRILFADGFKQQLANCVQLVYDKNGFLFLLHPRRVTFPFRLKEVMFVNYIVLDLEWNQAEYHHPYDPLTFEIIEIGAVKLDEFWNVIDRFSMLVRPCLYPKLFRKISGIVPVTEEELRVKGRPFPYAFQKFWEWCGDDVMFCTWGCMDLTELQRNIAYHRLPNPFRTPLFYLDIQKLYSIDRSYGKCRHALDTAIEQLSLPVSLPFHRAVNDAYYTALIMKHLNRDRVEKYKSLDYFHLPSSRQEEVYMVFDNYSKFVSRVFGSREEALLDRRLLSTVCFLCGANVRKKAPWFSFYGKWYCCLALCPRHGWIRGKIRFKKVPSSEEHVYAVKTIKVIPESEAKTLLAKRKELQQKRRIKQSTPQNALTGQS